MNCLLLDDELLVVESLQQRIDWKGCGISQTFVCDNVPDAKECMQQQTIEIVVTDIEMPGEDGISFAKWIRERFPDTCIFFLTGYAQFEYAREAVSLGVKDYVLKPVDYQELQDKIKAAAAQMAQRQESALQQEEGSGRWGDLVNYVIGAGRREEGADPDYAIQDNSETGTDLDRILQRFHIALLPEDRYILVWLSMRDENPGRGLEETRQKLEEIGNAMGFGSIAVCFSAQKIFACYTCAGEADPDRIITVREKVSDLLADSQEKCICLLSDELTRQQVLPMISKMHEREKKNVVYQNRLILVGNRNVAEGSSLPAENLSLDCAKCGVYFDNGEFDKVRSEIDMTLHRIVLADRMDVSALQNIYNDFLQLIVRFIGQQFSLRGRIMNDEKFMYYQRRAVNSVEDFRTFVNYVLQQLQQSVELENENAVIGRVKDYVDTHLTEKLSRKEIADYAGFHENYLSRLFHKEYGCSISTYIQRARLGLAKKYLIQTRLPVSEIGEKVGYETTSYFIRVFRNETGMTPSEYRKEMRV